MCVQVTTEKPGAEETMPLWDPDWPDRGYLPKFILPLLVGLFGFIEFVVVGGVLLYICFKQYQVTYFWHYRKTFNKRPGVC